jgi:Ca-activated chloride channel homolog
VPLGDLRAGEPLVLLLEFLSPPRAAGRAALGRLTVGAAGAQAALDLVVSYRADVPPPPPQVLDAAARAAAARLQQRALEAAARSERPEAARLLRAAAGRLDDLGEHALADIARDQAATIERTGQANALATKELTYATRRLGGE